MNQQTLSLAGKYAETLNTQNIDLFDTFIANDYVNHNPSVAPGLHGVKEFFAGWLAAFPDTTVIMEDAFVAGDRVVGRYIYRATHQGTFLGIPPTGKQITMRSIDIWRVRDNVFVEHWDELNLLDSVRLPSRRDALALKDELIPTGRKRKKQQQQKKREDVFGSEVQNENRRIVRWTEKEEATNVQYTSAASLSIRSHRCPVGPAGSLDPACADRGSLSFA